MAEFKLDLARRERIGLDEAIFCAGKTADQVAAILDSFPPGGGLLLTRLDAAKLEALPARLRSALDYEPLSRTAILGAPRPARAGAPVAVVMAGTSDVPMGREACRTLFFNGQPHTAFTDIGVAGLWRLMERIEEIRREACRTLFFNGQPHTAFTDIGVAGLWRLMERIEEIRRAPVVVVAAGMDAALVSVVGGLVRAPVVALPTSVGYGVAEGGTPALHSALASCAPGVAVVNIDNGYGAASAALRICNVLAGPGEPAPRAGSAHAVTP